jgi:flagellar motor protein MotB
MKRSNTRCRPATSALAVLLIAAAGTGCVTRGKYDGVVDDLEHERERVKALEASNEALGGERLKLIDEMEDLRVAKEGLTEDVAKLEKTRDLLTTNLREHEAKVAELSKKSVEYEGLTKELEQEVASGQIQITQLREGLRLNLAQDILFRSGSATLEPYGVELLSKVSEQLAKQPQQVEVQGHTDNVPASVVRLFEKKGLDPAHLRAVSYGEHAPVDDNSTAEGRARNRRIEIRLKPIDAPGTGPDEPASTGAATGSATEAAAPTP